MSDTPRTDAAALMAADVDATDYVVPADFARQLERELAKAQDIGGMALLMNTDGPRSNIVGAYKPDRVKGPIRDWLRCSICRRSLPRCTCK